MITFYKGVLVSDLKSLYVPGTVTTSLKEALMWRERIDSNKTKGIHKNIRHGKSAIISFIWNDLLADHLEFQRAGVEEHKRNNCWTSLAKSKAQINEIISEYKILSEIEIDQAMRLENKRKFY